VIVLGIAGGSASGKTTVTNALAVGMGDRAAVLYHDRYYRTPPADVPPARWNYDHPDALETDLLLEHLETLRAGRPARVPRYDFSRHRRADGFDVVAPSDLVIVEGILVLADGELRRALDLKVFVDCAADLRLMRRMRRDVAERGRDPLGVLDQYEQTVRPMHETFVQPSSVHADLVLDGARPVADSTRAVHDLLHARGRVRSGRSPRGST
jgi:uridine kinase